MSKHNHQESSSDKRAAKKALVLGSEKKSPLLVIVILIAVALVGGAIVFAVTVKKNNTLVAVAQTPVKAQPAAQAPAQPAAAKSADVVTYPSSLFASGQAQFFEYKDGNITIKYFILKGADNIIRTAFDACDVCWPAGKGYHQEGDDMVCNNCGRHFPSKKIGEIHGGCNPAPLKQTVAENTVAIKLDDLREGRRFFDFSQKS